MKICVRAEKRLTELRKKQEISEKERESQKEAQGGRWTMEIITNCSGMRSTNGGKSES
jgi:hypothetical protein